MPQQAGGMWNVDSAENEPASLNQAVNIVAMSDPHVLSPFAVGGWVF